jgi:hypothetical protein
VTRNPDDTSSTVGHNRHSITLPAVHFAVDQHILHFLASTQTERPQTVARTPVPYRQVTLHCRRVDLCNVGLNEAALRKIEPFGFKKPSGEPYLAGYG